MNQTLLTLSNIAEADRAKLITEWGDYYQSPLPKGISTKLLRRALAFQVQASELGGLRPKNLTALLKCASLPLNTGSAQVSGFAPAKMITRKTKPGARLIREWNGVNHIVDVVEGGFIWKNRWYKSLSKIAREITGARWSGPRFFGLRVRQKAR